MYYLSKRMLDVLLSATGLSMSDDYNAYYYYLDAGFRKVPCYILGETTLPVGRIGTNDYFG